MNIRAVVGCQSNAEKFSKTGRTIYYRGQTFQSLKGRGFKSNYYCVETGEDYWISGPKRRGGDALYGGSIPIEIDEDEREEYWRDIRQQPDRVHDPSPDPPCCWKGELPRAPLRLNQGLAVARPSREAGMLLEICRSGGRRCGWIRAGCRSDSKPQHIPARCGWSGDTAAVRFRGKVNAVIEAARIYFYNAEPLLRVRTVWAGKGG